MYAYRRLLGIFYRNALMNELEYRLNFWSLLVLQLFWLIWSAVGVRIPFLYADRLAGWSYPELLVVLGMFHFMKGYQSLVLEPNLSQMSEYVRLGTLDYILTKPIDSQFMVSLRNLGLSYWADPFLSLGLIGYGLWTMGYLPSLLNAGAFVLITLAAMIVLYSLSLAIQSLTFWLVNLEGADTLVDTLVEAGRFPIAFFNGWLRYVLTAILPVALVTTFPAQALLGRGPDWMAPLAVAIALASFIVASAFWRFALRSYTSASS
jgi:ABC-2 type transport system permease protein